MTEPTVTMNWIAMLALLSWPIVTAVLGATLVALVAIYAGGGAVP